MSVCFAVAGQQLSVEARGIWGTQANGPSFLKYLHHKLCLYTVNLL